MNIQIDKFTHGFLIQDALELKKEQLLQYINECEQGIDHFNIEQTRSDLAVMYERDVQRYHKDIEQINYLIDCLNP